MGDFTPKPGDVFRTAQRQITILRVLDRHLILQVTTNDDRQYIDHMRISAWRASMPRHRRLWKNGKDIARH